MGDNHLLTTAMIFSCLKAQKVTNRIPARTFGQSTSSISFVFIIFLCLEFTNPSWSWRTEQITAHAELCFVSTNSPGSDAIPWVYEASQLGGWAVVPGGVKAGVNTQHLRHRFKGNHKLNVTDTFLRIRELFVLEFGINFYCERGTYLFYVTIHWTFWSSKVVFKWAIDKQS